jgi:predicted ArsR family transcriptional regulator
MSEAAKLEHSRPALQGGPPCQGEASEAFRSRSRGRRGLGHTTERWLDRLLRHGPQSASELADFFGRDRDTARYHLRKLHAARLAERREDGRWAATGRDPAEVARQLGLADATAHQQQRHRRQRMAAARWQRHVRRRRTKR